MSESTTSSELKKYRCWISEKEKIISFHFEDGYELKEFNTYNEFQDFYYQKSIETKYIWDGFYPSFFLRGSSFQ